MTVVAWDGKTLAADKMAASVGYGYTVTKLHRLWHGGIVGFSGDGDEAMALLAWLNSNDQNPDKYPASMKDGNTSALEIDPDGTVWSWGKTPYPQRVECRFYAMGHGRDFALAAMHLGKTAREAVEVACALDVFCGNGIDTMEPSAVEE